MRILWAGLMLALLGQALPPAQRVTLRSILVEELRTTHTQKDWFVPANVAIEGLTAKQASWTDGSGNHSIGQLTDHLVFWNRRQLAKFKGESVKSNIVNDETFNSFDSAKWTATARELDDVLTAWEKLVEGASEGQLESWASTIAHVASHNAYHIGQFVYVRKLQGSWDPNRGVK